MQVREGYKKLHKVKKMWVAIGAAGAIAVVSVGGLQATTQIVHADATASPFAAMANNPMMLMMMNDSDSGTDDMLKMMMAQMMGQTGMQVTK